MSIDRNTTYVKIIEEPAAKALRFRYECEGRSAGSLPGAGSTSDKKTFPKIQVLSAHPLGKGVVVVSCVTVDPPYRPHPHNLVGKEGCKKGVCTMEITTDTNMLMTCEFSNLGIQCVKKKDIEESLKVREEIRVDPFRTGFSHKTQPGSIDLNSVRLCFQVFLEGPERGQFKVPLKPVVSEAIYDKKAINDLTIMKLSDCTSPVLGNKEIILLCDKVSKDDIEIRFWEEQNNATIWEAFGDFQPSDVHKQYAITFRTPQFRDLEITTPCKVWIQLRCPSKETTSSPRPFDYVPISGDLDVSGMYLKRKRLNTQRMDNHLNLSFKHQQHSPQLPQQSPQLLPQIPQQLPQLPQQQLPQQQEQYNYPYIKQEPGTSNIQQYYNYPPDNVPLNTFDLSNISLPNLSDVNLSLLESHLSENFNENLNLNVDF